MKQTERLKCKVILAQEATQFREKFKISLTQRAWGLQKYG